MFHVLTKKKLIVLLCGQDDSQLMPNNACVASENTGQPLLDLLTSGSDEDWKDLKVI